MQEGDGPDLESGAADGTTAVTNEAPRRSNSKRRKVHQNVLQNLGASMLCLFFIRWRIHRRGTSEDWSNTHVALAPSNATFEYRGQSDPEFVAYWSRLLELGVQIAVPCVVMGTFIVVLRFISAALWKRSQLQAKIDDTCELVAVEEGRAAEVVLEHNAAVRVQSMFRQRVAKGVLGELRGLEANVGCIARPIRQR